MQKNIVFLTGEIIGANVSETIHLYRRMESFKKSGVVSVITQTSDLYPEEAGCKKKVVSKTTRDVLINLCSSYLPFEAKE